MTKISIETFYGETFFPVSHNHNTWLSANMANLAYVYTSHPFLFFILVKMLLDLNKDTLRYKNISISTQFWV